MTFEYYDQTWALQGRLQGFQTIDADIQQPDEPYQQLPQLIATGNWRNSLLGLDYQLASEANYFHRKESVTGARINVRPAVSAPMQRGGLYITPRVALDYAGYSLNDTAPDQSTSPSRLVPVASIDAGAVFERPAGNDQDYLITLEPRALYAYVPFHNQDDLPVFDTVQPDFNFVQLYRYNRFIGPDRLADTNQLSLGFTSRILSASSGRELLTATLGQTIFFEDSDVTLPDQLGTDENSSDYIAELGINVWKKWSIDLRYQYDTDTRSSARTAIRVKYRPGAFMAFNVAYRYARDSLEQTDISFSYPLGSRWSAIGRYNYSLPDNKALDQFLGIEYNSCCWGISFLSRQTISRSTGETDSSIALQFVLKGFSNFGSKTSQDLQRDILGETRF
jgi:LPS-assembly protein